MKLFMYGTLVVVASYICGCLTVAQYYKKCLKDSKIACRTNYKPGNGQLFNTINSYGSDVRQ